MQDLPFLATTYYRSLAQSEDPDSDPIAAQFMPRDAERHVLPYETTDPLADGRYEVAPRVVHHYRDRILILAHDRCAMYCRHCFRRHFTATGAGGITPGETAGAVAYLKEHLEVTEAVISGGDPLLLGAEKLSSLLTALWEARPGLIVRISTRVPVVAPHLVTTELVSALDRGEPLWMVVQTNHPREITREFRTAVMKFVKQGIPVLNQSVLLRGINDSVETLESLFRELVRSRVKPYYLFQGDLAAGTSHFRTSIDTGLELMRQLRPRLSGIALPTYAVDLPDGGGKVPLNDGSVVREGSWYVIKDLSGTEHRYPVEE